MRWLAPALLLALAACSTLERLVPAEPAAPVPAKAAGAGSQKPAPVSEARPTSDMGRIRAAMAILANPSGDESEALALVEPVARARGGDADARAMAGFLQAMALERRRLKESAAGAAARLRDERKATEAQKLRADALQERAAELQQKLDALADLEKTLSEKQVPNR
jgi:hypothetical protein